MTKFKKLVKLATATATVLALSPRSVLAEDIRTINLETIDPKWDPITDITPDRLLVFLINGLLIVAGLIAFFFLLIGGVQWIMAGGDKEGTEKARKRITSSIIGLAIVFSAYAMAFLVQAVFGVSILNFTIPTITGSS